MDSVVDITNHKGQTCYKPLPATICQEGYCSECMRSDPTPWLSLNFVSKEKPEIIKAA